MRISFKSNHMSINGLACFANLLKKNQKIYQTVYYVRNKTYLL